MYSLKHPGIHVLVTGSVRHTTLFSIVGATLAAALLGCVGGDAITRPDLKQARNDGVPIAGPMSRQFPMPGALSTTSPAWSMSAEWTALKPSADLSSGVFSAAAAGGAIRMLWQNTTTGERSIWVMSGTSYSSAVLLPNVPTAWSIAGSGDFNADGQADIVWQNLTTGDRSIWFMNGNSYASAALLPNVPTQWSIAGAGDFNADGKPDIVWQNLTTGDRSIWFMNGSTYVSAALLPNVSTAWKIVAVGDFNADGKPDLVWQRPGTGESSIWFMNGSTYSSAALLPTVPTAWRIAAAADFDGDGRPDLVWQNVNTGERSIWLMNGSSFAGAAILPTVPIQWSIAGVLEGPPAPIVPAAPSGLTATPASPSQINLAWLDNSSNETDFLVEQCAGASCTNFVELTPAVPANNTAANVTGLSASTAYRYRVRAHNAVGYSAYSNIASATTLAPSQITVFASYDNTIAFATNNTARANTVYSGGDFGVGCSYSVGPYVSDAFCNAALLRFDASQAQIAGRVIASAVLALQPDLLPADRGTVYAANAIFDPWNPATVTWNTQPRYITTGEIDFYPPASGATMTFDVTSWAQNWANASWPNNGIILRDLSTSIPSISLVQATYFQSLENYMLAAYRPHLVINFQ